MLTFPFRPAFHSHMPRHSRRRLALLVPFSVVAIACGKGSDTQTAPEIPTGPVALASANANQAATVGTAFSYDPTKGNAAFTDPAGKGLTYAVNFAPSANGLTFAAGRVTGVPATTGLTTVTITASDSRGTSASNSFVIASFAAGLTAPVLPASAYAYRDAAVPAPGHFLAQGPGGSVSATDNSPADNAITDAGAALGRVLFYDKRVSANDQVSCASCHQQQFGFSDTAKLSRGFLGGTTGRHAMALANARYYQRGRFFWDERASTLEEQVLQPIQNAVEMGMTLDNLEIKLATTTYYPALFQAAFGTSAITRDRIAKALAQFTRSLVSSNSKFDRAFAGGGPNFPSVFTAQEIQGQQLFDGPAGCVRCHATNAHVSDDVHNTGLDLTITDVGAGNGRFKAPSLTNIALRAPYMHDGRFGSLGLVVEFYNSQVMNSPGLDNRLRAPGGAAQRLGLSFEQKAALVAYLQTFTDSTFVLNPRFASPFP